MNNRRLCRVLLLLIVCCLAFIWGNSLLPGDESGDISHGLLAWLIRHFPFLEWLPEYLLRKLGHLCEFAGTAFLMTWFFIAAGERGHHRIAMPLLCALLTATADETIQLFVPGRSCKVTDVWIDTLGACCGIAALMIGYALYRNHRAKG